MGRALSVTTDEAAETDLSQKMIWLEGTGVAPGNSEALIETMQASIQPEGGKHWAAIQP